MQEKEKDKMMDKDKDNKKKSCERCGYNLFALHGVCPKCGARINGQIRTK